MRTLTWTGARVWACMEGGSSSLRIQVSSRWLVCRIWALRRWRHVQFPAPTRGPNVCRLQRQRAGITVSDKGSPDAVLPRGPLDRPRHLRLCAKQRHCTPGDLICGEYIGRGSGRARRCRGTQHCRARRRPHCLHSRRVHIHLRFRRSPRAARLWRTKGTRTPACASDAC